MAAEPTHRDRQRERLAGVDDLDPGTLRNTLAEYRCRSRSRDEEYAEAWLVEQQAFLELQLAAIGDDDLGRVPVVPKRMAERDELRMPDRKHCLSAPRGLGAGHDCVCIDPGKPFVHQMFVGLASAQRRRIVGDGVAVARL